MKISASVSIPTIGKNRAKYPAETRKALSKWAAKTLNKMQSYPPQLAHVKYRRTGRYGRNWRSQVGATEAKVSNNTDYAEFLGGDHQVSWAAARGWEQLSEVAEENAQELRDDVFQAARDAIA